MEEPKGYWRVFHSYGCRQIVFYVKHKPSVGLQLYAEDVICLDGSTPKPTDQMICGSCGENVEMGMLMPNDATLIE